MFMHELKARQWLGSGGTHRGSKIKMATDPGFVASQRSDEAEGLCAATQLVQYSSEEEDEGALSDGDQTRRGGFSDDDDGYNYGNDSLAESSDEEASSEGDSSNEWGAGSSSAGESGGTREESYQSPQADDETPLEAQLHAGGRRGLSDGQAAVARKRGRETQNHLFNNLVGAGQDLGTQERVAHYNAELGSLHSPSSHGTKSEGTDSEGWESDDGSLKVRSAPLMTQHRYDHQDEVYYMRNPSNDSQGNHDRWKAMCSEVTPKLRGDPDFPQDHLLHVGNLLRQYGQWGKAADAARAMSWDNRIIVEDHLLPVLRSLLQEDRFQVKAFCKSRPKQAAAALKAESGDSSTVGGKACKTGKQVQKASMGIRPRSNSGFMGKRPRSNSCFGGEGSLKRPCSPRGEGSCEGSVHGGGCVAAAIDAEEEAEAERVAIQSQCEALQATLRMAECQRLEAEEKLARLEQENKRCAIKPPLRILAHCP